MAKYRVWAECISDVYLDVEAESEEEAFEIAEESDGGEWIEDATGGEFKIGSTIYELDDDE